MTTISDVTPSPAPAPVPAPVTIGRRGGPDVPTLRRDAWWVEPVFTACVLISFAAYATWAAFVNKDYFAGPEIHRNLLSPFYSPCLTESCVPGSHGSFVIHWWTLSPALLILIFPLGFRLTCYYYRKAYYRSIWWSPPSCAVSDAHKSYSGETRLPLILQNVHRWFFYLLLIFNVILTIDAIEAFRQPGIGIGVTVGTIVLCINAALLWLYSLSCHACRHACGGGLKNFSRHPIRHRLWSTVTPLNARHMQIAWASLFFVAFTDLYVRLTAAGWITDFRIF